MFPKMIAGLRSEAEKVSSANCQMLAHSRLEGWSLQEKVSGQTRNSRVMAGGALTSMGGMIGLIGVAAANQAAGALVVGATGLAGTSALATASTMLAGLGTVAVGSAILPVATVVTLGAAVAGLGIMAVSRLMPTDKEKGYAVSNAVKDNDLGKLSQIGKENIGLSDWLKGAKNFVVKSLQEGLGKGKPVQEMADFMKGMAGGGLPAPGVNQAVGKGGNSVGDAASSYELEDLLSDSFEESVAGKQKVVDKIGADIWEKHGVVVTDEKLHECLGATRGDSTSYGKILAVDLKSGLVVQNSGRGQATVHNLKDFPKLPVVGQDAEISYKGGKMQGAIEQGAERYGASVGR